MGRGPLKCKAAALEAVVNFCEWTATQQSLTHPSIKVGSPEAPEK
jgi:hypothetical protein